MLGPKQKCAGRLDGDPARWARPEKLKENRKSYVLQWSTGRIEMGCGKIPFKILNQGFGFK
jgi:hypothetical protein